MVNTDGTNAGPALPASLSGRRDRDPLMVATRALLTGFVSSLRPGRTMPPLPRNAGLLQCRVVATYAPAEETIALVIAATDHTPLPAWDPGAHIDLHLPSGLIRQYSLCGTDRSSYTVIVRDLPHARGPQEIKTGLRTGDPVAISFPRNLFPFAHPQLRTDGVTKVAFVAAGIGVTAIAPMARLAAATGVDWQLHYLGRSPSTMPLTEELTTLDPGRVTITTTSDTPHPTAQDLLQSTDSATAVYACGPTGLLDAIKTVAAQRAIGSLHLERFSAAHRPAGNAFRITLARSQLTAQVEPDISALEAVQRVLPAVPYSCRQGFCGTCRVPVLDGHVERRATTTFEDNPQSMLLCSDTATDDITIDL